MKLLFFIVLITGCGIKGPPLPPVTEETIQQDKFKEESGLSKPNTTIAPSSSDQTKPKLKK